MPCFGMTGKNEVGGRSGRNLTSNKAQTIEKGIRPDAGPHFSVVLNPCQDHPNVHGRECIKLDEIRMRRKNISNIFGINLIPIMIHIFMLN
jgi:hypothetical protein